MPQKVQNMIRAWETSCLLLGIYERLAEQDFEVASASAFEGYGGSCIGAQSVRKTCGAFFIAHSQVAVDDLYLHCVPPGAIVLTSERIPFP